jgi:large subunit ribosomal protein L18
MTKKKNDNRRSVPYRRKREGRTNYKKRLALIKSGENRVVVRKSLNTITLQVVQYEEKGDKTLVLATSHELPKLGWKLHPGSISSAYLTGLLLGVKAKKKKLTSGVLDMGVLSPARKGRNFAAVKGMMDAGMQVGCPDEVLPSADRISGKHIAQYATLIKKSPEKYQRQFSAYIKKGVNPEDITKIFDETKKKILAL